MHANAAKTSCKNGHLFTTENTYQTTAGFRECVLCKRELRRRNYAIKEKGLPRPSAKPLPTTIPVYLWKKVTRTNSCWIWRGYVENGYGRLTYGKTVRAHRFFYEVLRGGIPVGMDIDHLCTDRACVNPAHMEVVTRGENSRRRHLRSIRGEETDGKRKKVRAV